MIRRKITNRVIQSLRDFPVVLLNGARQVGKSTLAKELHREGILDHYITFDDFEALTSARADPDGFLNAFKGTVIIDEVQRVPDLLRAIKKQVDENKTPGRFLLTGSANILSYPRVTESLAGRMDIIALEGLDAREIASKAKSKICFLEDLFSNKSFKELTHDWNTYLNDAFTVSKEEILSHIFFGGYPDVALKQSIDFSKRWFNAYRNAYIERDVRDLSRILDVISFANLYQLVGLQTGNILNTSRLSQELKLDQRTVSRYLEILETTFQASRLKPWSQNDRKRYVRSPKIYLNDSGQACFLYGIKNPQHLQESRALGHLFETWLWAELRKLISVETGLDTHFYRTHNGQEIDFIISDGPRLLAVECKFSPRLHEKELVRLQHILENISLNARAIVIHTGNRFFPYGKNILGVPLKALF